MIFNGHYSLKPFNTFGAVVRYTCNEGYILSGQPERVCQGDGYWSGKPPTCETEGESFIAFSLDSVTHLTTPLSWSHACRSTEKTNERGRMIETTFSCACTLAAVTCDYYGKCGPPFFA